MKIKKICLFLIGLLLIFIITNPSIKAFKDYLGVSSYSGLRRTSNFFIFSFYRFGDDADEEYFAIAGNFIHLAPRRPVLNFNRGYSDSDTSKKPDTSVYLPNTTLIYDTIRKSGESLYDKLISDGYTKEILGNKDQFLIRVKDTAKAGKLYLGLIDGGYSIQQLGTEDQFLRFISHQ